MATMSALRVAPAQCFLVSNVSWRSYRLLGRALADRPIRLTYDRGVLELMTLSPEHEFFKKLLGRLIVALTEELDLTIASFGSMTFKKRKRRRGLEPDECYWIASEPKIRGKFHLDPRVDPAPDLAVEIDVTSSSINRLGIYAVLGVAEVWRFDGAALEFLVLGADGKYQPAPSSRSFPGLTPTDVVPFLNLRLQMDENAMVRQFRTWIRQHLQPPGP